MKHLRKKHPKEAAAAEERAAAAEERAAAAAKTKRAAARPPQQQPLRLSGEADADASDEGADDRSSKRACLEVRVSRAEGEGPQPEDQGQDDVTSSRPPPGTEEETPEIGLLHLQDDAVPSALADDRGGEVPLPAEEEKTGSPSSQSREPPSPTPSRRLEPPAATSSQPYKVAAVINPQAHQGGGQGGASPSVSEDPGALPFVGLHAGDFFPAHHHAFDRATAALRCGDLVSGLSQQPLETLVASASALSWQQLIISQACHSRAMAAAALEARRVEAQSERVIEELSRGKQEAEAEARGAREELFETKKALQASEEARDRALKDLEEREQMLSRMVPETETTTTTESRSSTEKAQDMAPTAAPISSSIAPSPSPPSESIDTEQLEIQTTLQAMPEKQCKSSTEKVQQQGITTALICSAQDEVVEAAQPPQQQPSPLPCASSGPSESSDRESNRQQQEAIEQLARMITLQGSDPSFVENKHFRSFVEILDPEFRVPSRSAIEQMGHGILDEAKRNHLDMIRRAPGKFSLAVGKAKTPEAGEVVYIVCHFIDDEWKLQKLVLDAYVASASDYVLVEVNKVNQELGIEKRLYMLAYDTTDDYFNAGMKSYVGILDIERRCTTYVDNVLHTTARRLLPLFTQEIHNIITRLSLTKQERQQLISYLGLDYLWAHCEHWYECYCSLEILRIKGSSDPPQNFYKETTELLCKVWDSIYGAIQRISSPVHPTSNLCLKELLDVQKKLLLQLANYTPDESALSRFGLNEDLANGLKDATVCLDKAIQSSYIVWSIPLVLDPRDKLTSCSTNFSCSYDDETAASYLSDVNERISKLCIEYAKDGRVSAIAAVNSGPIQQAALDEEEAKTELQRYLKDPPVEATNGFDILNWWKDNTQKYPTVARMARDALAMPTCSKLSSEQIAQVEIILRSYSNEAFAKKSFCLENKEGKNDDGKEEEDDNREVGSKLSSEQIAKVRSLLRDFLSKSKEENRVYGREEEEYERMLRTNIFI